jgi:uncharacterized membrane protein YebE (DUF533 family)
VDTTELLSVFVRGAIGSRGRKRARRAANFLSGKRGFLTAGSLLGAAGVAWGIYDSLHASSTTVPGTGASGAIGAAQPPPIPTFTPGQGAEEHGFPPDVLRVVRLAVSAARSDGVLLAAERALILGHARDAGVERLVDDELASPRPLAELVSGLTDNQHKRELYVIAFTIVRADETVSGAERIYLAQLAHQLGIAPSAVAELEQETAARIDATPEVED